MLRNAHRVMFLGVGHHPRTALSLNCQVWLYVSPIVVARQVFLAELTDLFLLNLFFVFVLKNHVCLYKKTKHAFC